MRNLLLVTTSIITLFAANQASAQTMSKEAVQTIVKEYLLANPEVVVDSLTAYQEKKAKAEADKSAKAIKDSQAALFNNKAVPSAGAADADVVIAEFFDYHCGYCKHMLPVITRLLKEDKKIRVVFHELPILSEDSQLASKAAIVVFNLKPEKYFDYHTTLMGMSGKYSEDNLAAAAKKLGISEKDFKAELAKPSIDAQLAENKKLSETIGISGTPAFVIGNEFIPGASSYEDMKKLIDKIRAAKTK